ncbi:MAG: AAA family ATPase [Oligoflexales bacterium]
MTDMTFDEVTSCAQGLKEKISNIIFGQEKLIEETLCCFLGGGHILMTGAPGLAKTTLVRVFGQYLGMDFGRVQFTPDLLPSDIVGSDILNIDPDSHRRHFEFSAGPVFKNLVLADEINRASPRTQSSLLEAMQERRVTVGGHSHELPSPFMVFATQNPFESEGTFPLPEAQLDRFLLHSFVDYPDKESEKKLLLSHTKNDLIGEKTQDLVVESLGGEVVKNLIQVASQIEVPEEIVEIITNIVRATRPHDELCPENLRQDIWYGAGPRAGISLISVARSYALLQGEKVVRWQHVERMALPCLRHRMRISVHSSTENRKEDDMILQILEASKKNCESDIRGELS